MYKCKAEKIILKTKTQIKTYRYNYCTRNVKLQTTGLKTDNKN